MVPSVDKKKVLEGLPIYFRYLYKQAKQFTSTHWGAKNLKIIFWNILTFLQI